MSGPLGRKTLWRAGFVLALVISFCPSPEARGQEGLTLELQSPRCLEIALGKSSLLRSSEPVKRITVANPDVADFNLLSPREIYLVGKRKGSTNLTVWLGSGGLEMYDVEVGYDVAGLKRNLNEIMPDEKNIRVKSFDDAVTLTGRISSSANLAQAMAIAESFAPKDKIRNLMEVGGVQQVMLEVRVSEMKKSLVKNLGVNWVYTDGGNFGMGMIGQLAQLVSEDPLIMSGDLGLSTSANTVFRFHNGRGTITGFVDALEQEGLAKVLAEPTLIALSGQMAEFLAGGEFPVPIPSTLGTIPGIEWKRFGVLLRFTPFVLGENKISINVWPEVSELDFNNSLRLGGDVIPGLQTRTAKTVVELEDGQSFAIAGLLSNNVKDAVEKYPFLGDIPVLGNLFRSRSFRSEESELVIIVTPHLVRPVDGSRQPLPTEFYVEPNDVDFYVWGSLEGKFRSPEKRTDVELDGEFGHTVSIVE